MKIEKAYSKDCNEVIDAELAYDYYWNGKIHNKQNFECPSELCDTNITCANLDKLRQNMKIDPHYKSVGEHSDDCILKKDILNKSKNTLSQADSPSKSRNSKSNDTADIFVLERPKSHWEREQINSFADSSSARIKRKRSIKQKARESYSSPPRYFSIMSLVSKYFKFKKENKLGDAFININGFNISYSDMFIDLAEQRLSSLSEYPRIYFGRAFVNLLRNGDYSINFTNKLDFQKSLITPSLYLSKKLIQESFSKKVKEKNSRH